MMLTWMLNWLCSKMILKILMKKSLERLMPRQNIYNQAQRYLLFQMGQLKIKLMKKVWMNLDFLLRRPLDDDHHSLFEYTLWQCYNSLYQIPLEIY
mmetsp:Transcript_21091/g.26564  ORF Transcript_21091/g.26564 Transcript_21091/m.26564 type:complete len:96 (-) Transcript_21091:185-472(-)